MSARLQEDWGGQEGGSDAVPSPVSVTSTLPSAGREAGAAGPGLSAPERTRASVCDTIAVSARHGRQAEAARSAGSAPGRGCRC